MKDLILLTIVKPLVDHPDAVSIETRKDLMEMTYKLSVHPEDMGKSSASKGA